MIALDCRAKKVNTESGPTDSLYTARAALRGYGKAADCDLDLAEAALLLAVLARPGGLVSPYRRHLDKLVTEVADYLGTDVDTAGVTLRHEALVQVLVKRRGYLGTTGSFDYAEVANLMGVIDRRSGLSVVLGILFLHVTDRLSWPAAGLDFPGRFLVRLDDGDGQRLIFDPFDEGRIVAAHEMREILKTIYGTAVELSPQHYRTMASREVLLRLQETAKKIHLNACRWNDAVEILEATLLIAPKVAALWFERGRLLTKMERRTEAIVSLEIYLSICRADNTSSSYEASLLLQRLKFELKSF